MNAAPSLDAVGSEKIRAKVARYFYSHPYFQAPTDRPKSIAGLLKEIGGSAAKLHIVVGRSRADCGTIAKACLPKVKPGFRTKTCVKTRT